MSAMPPMSPTAGSRSLVDRVKSILLQPRSEWAVIEAEPATVGSIYRYAAILAAIPTICGAIGLSTMGYFHFSGFWIVRFAVAQYVGSLIGVYVLALIIDALAPTFGGHKGQIAALKVSAYSTTAAWVAGIFSLIPALGILGLLGLYSLYLLYLGLPIVMKAPEDRAMGYTVVSIFAAIVIFILVRYLVGLASGMGSGMYSGMGGYR